MRIGFYQFKPVFGKVRHNLDKVTQALGQAEADLIVLPELPFTGYYFRDRNEVRELAEDIQASSTIDSLKALCKERDFYIVSGFAEKYRDKYYNSAVLIGPRGLIHVYRKLHLFNEEKLCFDAGDIPLQVQTVHGTGIGMMVCYDWAFPEVCRALALQGATIICHPSNLVLSWCQQTMLTRCLENRVFAVTANRYGNDKRPHGELEFTGKSQLVAPGGELVFAATARSECLYITDINPEQAQSKNLTELDDIFLDRRPEYYQKLSE